MKRYWFIAAALVVLVAYVLFFVPIPVHAQLPSYTLTWTAPGDDGNVGTASSYEMRWSATKPDSTSGTAMNSWWASATVVPNMPSPLIAGSTQTVNVAPASGFLSGTTYYFVIRASDEVPNVSAYSNVASKFTPDTTPPGRIIDLR